MKIKSFAEAVNSKLDNVSNSDDFDNDIKKDDEETNTSTPTSASFYDSDTLFEDFEDTIKKNHCNFLTIKNGTINYKKFANAKKPFIIYYYTLTNDSKGIEIGRIPIKYQNEIRLGGYTKSKNRHYFKIMSFTDELFNLCPEVTSWQDKIDSHH